MTPADGQAFLRHLASRTRLFTKPEARSLLLDDFYRVAVAVRHEDAAYLRAYLRALDGTPARDAATLLNGYLDRLPAPTVPVDRDLIIVCPKPAELAAIQVVLGLTPGEKSHVVHESGRAYFEGKMFSEVAGRELTWTLTSLSDQGNVVSATETKDILDSHRATLTVLVGMAAGKPGATRTCDVVVSQQVVYASSGTTSDKGFLADPHAHRPPPRVVTEVSAAMPQFNGWHDAYKVALARATAVGLPVTAGSEALAPSYKPSVILAGEAKMETTDFARDLERFSGDANAYDMESTGFAQACTRAQVPWVVFRGVADFAASSEGGEAVIRTKEHQTAATVSAATAFIVYVTRLSGLFGT